MTIVIKYIGSDVYEILLPEIKPLTYQQNVCKNGKDILVSFMPKNMYEYRIY